MSCQHHFEPSKIADYEFCSLCGTYHSTIAARPELIYGPDYWHGKHAVPGSNIWEQCWNVDMHTENGVSKNRYVIERIESARDAVLEIGCAPGRMLYWLTHAARFKNVVGVDPANPNDIRCLSAFYGEVIQGMFPQATLSLYHRRTSFDLVIGMDVFEHSFNPNEFLLECARLLRRHGQLILMLPLADNLPPGHHCWNPAEHVFIHSAKHMQQMLSDAAFGQLKFDRWAIGHDTVSARAI